MEWITPVTQLVAAIAWPVTVLVIFFYFKTHLGNILQQATTKLVHSRSVRARFGGMDVDLEAAERLQQKADEIAVEPDPAKRLQKVKQELSTADVLSSFDEADVTRLARLHRQCLTDHLLVSWRGLTDDEYKAIMKFQNNKLMAGIEVSQLYNDSLMWFTPLGVQVVRALGLESSKQTDSKN